MCKTFHVGLDHVLDHTVHSIIDFCLGTWITLGGTWGIHLNYLLSLKPPKSYGWWGGGGWVAWFGAGFGSKGTGLGTRA